MNKIFKLYEKHIRFSSLYFIWSFIICLGIKLTQFLSHGHGLSGRKKKEQKKNLTTFDCRHKVSTIISFCLSEFVLRADTQLYSRTCYDKRQNSCQTYNLQFCFRFMFTRWANLSRLSKINNCFVSFQPKNCKSKMFNQTPNFNTPLWHNGPQPGGFYNFPGSSKSMRSSNDNGTQRSA